MNETDLTKLIRIHLQEKFPGIVTWRNCIGFDDRAKVHYGIGGEGGSDILGIYRGRFLALEIKMPGARTEKERLGKQSNFIRVIRESGGLAGFASSLTEAEAIINGGSV